MPLNRWDLIKNKILSLTTCSLWDMLIYPLFRNKMKSQVAIIRDIHQNSPYFIQYRVLGYNHYTIGIEPDYETEILPNEDPLDYYNIISRDNLNIGDTVKMVKYPYINIFPYIMWGFLEKVDDRYVVYKETSNAT